MMADIKNSPILPSLVPLFISIALALFICAPATAYAALNTAQVQEADSQAISDETVKTQATTNASARTTAIKALEKRLNGMRSQLYVYKDFSDSMNHFTQKSMMWGKSQSRVKDPDENCKTKPHSGTSCIKYTHATNVNDWGGWEFYNGGGKGLDLTGATELRFWARGNTGGEIIDFFVAGGSGDKTRAISKNSIKLTKKWKQYAISLRGANLSNVHRGFGYAIDYAKNRRSKTVFYLDDIRFIGKIESLQEAPMMLRSYDTSTLQTRNAAFTYDNALAAMAFMSAGRSGKAAEILDALVYAIEHDRYANGRIRNAYAAGNITPFPGSQAGARLPGWWDTGAQAWYEDRYQVGSNVGNTSYAALALLHYAEAYKSSYRSNRYLEAASSIMDWVIAECSDSSDGFTAGYDGWPENGNQIKFTYKSTEHNIDAYAAFTQLYKMTGVAKYKKAADSALAFVKSMYDEKKGLFYSGTNSDGSTNESNIVLDAQVWAALALGNAFKPYEGSLGQLGKMRTAEGGYRFHVCAEKAFWCEGTAFTSLLHKLRGEKAAAEKALTALRSVQLSSGLFPAATSSNLSTGIYLSDGSPWVYGKDAAVAPTAWFVMALNSYNPYAFKSSESSIATGKTKLTINKGKIVASDVAKTDRETVRQITLGKKVKWISAKAFAKCPKLKTLFVKSSKLTAKTVKNSLKGSQIRLVKVKTKKLAAKYKKIFTKKNCGKKVKVTY